MHELLVNYILLGLFIAQALFILLKHLLPVNHALIDLANLIFPRTLRFEVTLVVCDKRLQKWVELLPINAESSLIGTYLPKDRYLWFEWAALADKLLFVVEDFGFLKLAADWASAFEIGKDKTVGLLFFIEILLELFDFLFASYFELAVGIMVMEFFDLKDVLIRN